MFARTDRPWGRMWMLLQTKRLWVKIITVDAGQATSKQYHLSRRELHVGLDRWHWRYIPRLRIHTMFAGTYLEIAWGHPAEEDIVRLSDLYGRT